MAQTCLQAFQGVSPSPWNFLPKAVLCSVGHPLITFFWRQCRHFRAMLDEIYLVKTAKASGCFFLFLTQLVSLHSPEKGHANTACSSSFILDFHLCPNFQNGLRLLKSKCCILSYVYPPSKKKHYFSKSSWCHHNGQSVFSFPFGHGFFVVRRLWSLVPEPYSIATCMLFPFSKLETLLIAQGYNHTATTERNR